MRTKAVLNCVLALLLALSLLPALFAPYDTSPAPLAMALIGHIYHFLVSVNLWPFLFLQLLLCFNLEKLWGKLLIPGLAAAGLAGGFLFTIIYSDVGGLLVIILTVIFFPPPLIGSLLGLAAWALLRQLGLR